MISRSRFPAGRPQTTYPLIASSRLPSSRVRSAIMSMPKLKLYYFELAGRAETTRILLNYGGIPYENFIFQRDQWAELKSKMPFGQVPVLEVDGKMLAQSSAIERFAARLAGLYPEDFWAASKVDEAVGFMGEMLDLFIPTFSIKDAEAKILARKEIVAGSLKLKITKLGELLTAAGGKFLTGDKITYADIAAFHMLSLLASGWLDGVPTTLLDDFPDIKAFHNRIAAIPQIAKMYENATGDRVSYKPL